MTLSELVPAEPRDLTELLRDLSLDEFREHPTPDLSDRKLALWKYLVATPKAERQRYWHQVCDRLLSRGQIEFDLVGDEKYPQALICVYDAPPFLFSEGVRSSELRPSISIVGSREAQKSALEATAKVAAAAAAAGIVVVSGLAVGIDTAAHIGALEAKGTTIAVVAGGIDHPLSRHHNEELARRVVSTGCLYSPFRPTTPPTSSGYVARNAVVSGLTAASLVMEGSENGGSQSESEFALKQGRIVMLWKPILSAVPWAERAALHPLVRWVSSVEDVVEIAREAST